MIAQGPNLEKRRSADFERELRERARAWIPGWGLESGQHDFGGALLEVAARFSAEVAERLDRAGSKMARGLLDWLAVRGQAARPARMPIVFKLADTAAAVDAVAPVKLQVDVEGTSIVFETQTDLHLVPGRLDLVIGVDPAHDAYYIPPPGLSSLEPLEPLPTTWQVKSFAAPSSTKLQLDPAQGLIPATVIEIERQQFRIVDAKGDLVTIEPAVPAGDGFAEKTPAKKISIFAPFDSTARNWQSHLVYLGDSDLLKLDASAYIDVVGGQNLGSNATWEYWGKNTSGDDPDKIAWWPLPPDSSGATIDGATALQKPAGSVEMFKVGDVQSRWIRARVENVGDCVPALVTDELALRINDLTGPRSIASTSDLVVQAFVNTTQTATTNFYPLGRSPRMFDTLYLGCAEAFAKPKAAVDVEFDLADTSFWAMAALDAGPTNGVLAGVDHSGALHLLQINPVGTLTPLFGRGPLQPNTAGNATAGTGAVRLTQGTFRPLIWSAGADFFVAVAAGPEVWVWHEHGGEPTRSSWETLGAPLPGNGSIVDVQGLALVDSAGAPAVVALRGQRLSLRTLQSGPWIELVAQDAIGDPLDIASIASIRSETSSGLMDAAIGITSTNDLYHIGFGGATFLFGDVAVDVGPSASQNDGTPALHIVAVSAADHNKLKTMVVPSVSFSPPPPLPAVADIPLDLGDQVSDTVLDARIESLGLTVYGVAEHSNGVPYVQAYRPPLVGGKFKIEMDPNAGVPTGALTLHDSRALMPGTLGNVMALSLDATPRTWASLIGDTTSNPDLTWEYWNGTGWSQLQVTGDTTLNLKRGGDITFDAPTDLKSTDWAGKTDHWIRARLIGGDYGTGEVVVTSTTSGNTTTQKVDQSTDGIQAPYAMKVSVSYQLKNAVLPTYLITEDSGTRRDQSDANRTPEAQIEIFTPLCATLRKLENPSASPSASTATPCSPDCDCGSASTSTSASTISVPAPPPAPAAPSPSEGRALMLGFSTPPAGEPVNILIVADKENTYDGIAPLVVEALVGGRFEPVISADSTRAMGETGIVSMAFPVPPSSAELFGRSLTWLRLTPSGQDANIRWAPSLRGVYLNAVWARSAETMTRELVGSSEGAPNISLQLARPPVLQDTLELRVREPLGEEDRAWLRASDKTRVLSDVDNLPGDWVRWKSVLDPADYGPGDRVYSLDETTGAVRFGDGLHGMIPPIGVDAIVAFSYQRTEPAPSVDATDPTIPGQPATPGSTTVGLLPANSIASRTTLNLVSPVDGVEAATAADQSAGGASTEADERVLRFAPLRLRHRERALTLRDFEDIALESSSDFVQARAFPRRGGFRLVVVMRGANPQPTKAARRELRRTLLAAAPPQLVTPAALQIEGPVVRHLRVTLLLEVATLDVSGALANYAKQVLSKYFDTMAGGLDQVGWPLGAGPAEDDIALALLDAPNLESLEKITFAEIAADGSASAWNSVVRSNELVMLADDGVRVEFRIAEAVQ